MGLWSANMSKIWRRKIPGIFLIINKENNLKKFTLPLMHLTHVHRHCFLPHYTGQQSFTSPVLVTVEWRALKRSYLSRGIDLSKKTSGSLCYQALYLVHTQSHTHMYILKDQSWNQNHPDVQDIWLSVVEASLWLNCRGSPSCSQISHHEAWLKTD